MAEGATLKKALPLRGPLPVCRGRRLFSWSHPFRYIARPTVGSTVLEWDSKHLISSLLSLVNFFRLSLGRPQGLRILRRNDTAAQLSLQLISGSPGNAPSSTSHATTLFKGLRILVLRNLARSNLTYTRQCILRGRHIVAKISLAFQTFEFLILFRTHIGDCLVDIIGQYGKLKFLDTYAPPLVCEGLPLLYLFKPFLDPSVIIPATTIKRYRPVDRLLRVHRFINALAGDLGYP